MTDAQSFIFGVHHFCDHRCWRCPLAARCRVHDRWRRTPEAASVRKQPAARVALIVKTAMEVTLEELEMMAELHGVPFEPPHQAAGAAADVDDDRERHFRAAAESPLGVAAHEYADHSWRVLRGLRSVLAARRDRDGLDACERLEEMCFTVPSKIVRCLAGAAHAAHNPGDLQSLRSDANGSAKVALLLIEESRQAWRVLMQPGRARGGGAPARFVRLLDGLEAELLQTFPRALEFVRPGFDTGEMSGAGGEVARAMLLAGTGEKTEPN